MYAICGTHQGFMRAVEYHPYIYEFLPRKGDAILYGDAPSVYRTHFVLTLHFLHTFTLLASTFSEPVPPNILRAPVSLDMVTPGAEYRWYHLREINF